MNPRLVLVTLLLTAPLLTPAGPARAADDMAVVAWRATHIPQAD